MQTVSVLDFIKLKISDRNANVALCASVAKYKESYHSVLAIYQVLPIEIIEHLSHSINYFPFVSHQ